MSAKREPPLRAPQQARSVETFNRMLDAVEDLLRPTRFDAMTISEVAEKAHVTRSRTMNSRASSRGNFSAIWGSLSPALGLMIVAFLPIGSNAKGERGFGLDAFRPTAACPAATAAAFAWWVGKWDYAVPKFDPAVSTVTSTDDGCTLAEAFVDRTGQQQHTTIQYDSVGHQWKRHVVDPFRTYDSAGTFAADGSIAFYESKTERESYVVTDRDHVHFTGEHSDDGGRTWMLLFDATYTRQR